MVRKPTYADQPYKPRGYIALRTGLKKFRGRDGEIIFAIYKHIGMQRFTYAEAKSMLLEREGIELPQQKLGKSFVGWGWLVEAGKTVENKPRIIYQISEDAKERIEAIITGKHSARYALLAETHDPNEGWQSPWDFDYGLGQRGRYRYDR